MTNSLDLPVLLVVEDDEGLQRQLKWAYDGYRVVVAGDRASAIAALRLHEPSVVTLDLGLPPDPDGTEEGFATLTEMVRLKPDTKVIVASGHGARESSYVNSTSFVRSSSRPMELVSIRYDRYESLVRAGVIPQYGWADPNPRPFPKSSRSAGYVPDPPSR